VGEVVIGAEAVEDEEIAAAAAAEAVEVGVGVVSVAVEAQAPVRCLGGMQRRALGSSSQTRVTKTSSATSQHFLTVMVVSEMETA